LIASDRLTGKQIGWIASKQLRINRLPGGFQYVIAAALVQANCDRPRPAESPYSGMRMSTLSTWPRLAMEGRYALRNQAQHTRSCGHMRSEWDSRQTILAADERG